jgi:hypothetical protein
MHQKANIHLAYASKLYYFHIIFLKTSLNLNFFYNVHLQMHYGCT